MTYKDPDVAEAQLFATEAGKSEDIELFDTSLQTKKTVKALSQMMHLGLDQIPPEVLELTLLSRRCSLSSY